MRHCRCRQNRSAESIADALADRGSVADAGTISEEGIFGDAGADADKIEDGNADGDHVAGAVAGAVSVADADIIDWFGLEGTLERHPLAFHEQA